MKVAELVITFKQHLIAIRVKTGIQSLLLTAYSLLLLLAFYWIMLSAILISSKGEDIKRTVQ